jgi:CMP-N-acetylneuraminic acid synthetase
MNLIVGIFARGGSKGVENKNMLDFRNETLIARTIKQAKEIVEVGKIFVSTDSAAIAQEAMKMGAQVPFFRPKELASDSSPEILSWKHLLENVVPKFMEGVEVMLVLPVTSPLRRTQDIRGAISLFNSSDCDIVVSVSQSIKNPYFNMLEENSNGFLELSKSSEVKVTRRQETPKVWEMNNAIYVAKSSYIFQCDNLLEGKVLGFEIPTEYSLDIDSSLDVEYLRFLERRMQS